MPARATTLSWVRRPAPRRRPWWPSGRAARRRRRAREQRGAVGPSTWRISKSSPSSATADGASFSASRTTGRRAVAVLTAVRCSRIGDGGLGPMVVGPSVPPIGAWWPLLDATRPAIGHNAAVHPSVEAALPEIRELCQRLGVGTARPLRLRQSVSEPAENPGRRGRPGASSAPSDAPASCSPRTSRSWRGSRPSCGKPVDVVSGRPAREPVRPPARCWPARGTLCGVIRGRTCGTPDALPRTHPRASSQHADRSASIVDSPLLRSPSSASSRSSARR